MPRLSIVIPSLSFDPRAEDTLVSVLQNRPEYSEIIVVTSQPYDDPYGLGREVRFVASESSLHRIDLLNHGCSQARGDVIHILLPGVEVLDGWTDHIWQHFVNEQVGAVAPVVLVNATALRAAALGVTYFPRGERRLVGAGASLEHISRFTILSPTLAAGFYRREPLLALQGFDREFGESLADVELGLALRDIGYSAVVEAQSRVVQTTAALPFPRTYREGEQIERLYQRHLNSMGSSPLGHAMVISLEMLRAFPRLRMLSCLFGRWAGRRADNLCVEYESRLEQARAELQRQHEELATITVNFGAGISRSAQPEITSKRRRSAA